MKYLKILIAIIITLTFACKKNVDENKLKGIIKAQGITTCMYGTHVLINRSGETLYALRSNSVKLNDYIDKTVEISGAKIEGYPVDGGPEYIEVARIK